MKFCFNRRGDRIAVWFVIILLSTIALFLLSISAYQLVICISAGRFLLFDAAFEIFCLGIAILCFQLVCMMWRFYMRRYSIEADGLWVAVGHKMQYIPWNQISEIALSVFGGNATLEAYREAIILMISPDTVDLMKDSVMRREGFFFFAKRTEQFVVIEFSQEILEAIYAVYPGTIREYRRKQMKFHSSGGDRVNEALKRIGQDPRFPE